MAPSEGLFSAGVIVGIIICHFGAQSLGLHPIVGLIAGVFLGAGIGYAMKTAYLGMRKPPSNHDKF